MAIHSNLPSAGGNLEQAQLYLYLNRGSLLEQVAGAKKKILGGCHKHHRKWRERKLRLKIYKPFPTPQIEAHP